MPPAAISANNAMLLEEPFIRTPYELLRRSHRSAQRQVERDFTAVQTALTGLLKSLKSSDKPDGISAATVTKLDQSSERVRGLKRKLDDLQPSSSRPTPLRSRVTYLEGVLSPGIQPAVDGKLINGAKGEVQDDAMGELSGTNEQSAVKVEIGEAVMEDEKMDGVRASGVTGEVASTKMDGRSTASDKTLDRYIVDYLLRTGRMKTARALTERQDLDQMVDLKLFAELIKIESALTETQSVAEALAWCGENRGTLKKIKNNLEFTLRLQEFIELCRKRDTIGAIAYSRKNLAPWAGSHMSEIQQGMTLLAFGEKTGVGMYRNLYDPSRWQAVRSHFRETFLSLYALPSQPLLSLALSAGLSALRLPSCVRHIPLTTPEQPKSPIVPLLPAAPPLHNLEDALLPDLHMSFPHLTAPVGGLLTDTNDDLREHPDMPTGNVDCPTCGEELKVLAREVPMSHHVNSTIVCRISGQVMDSDNEPMAFPNGYVYSSKALAEMAKNSFDVVTCPRTRESCAFGRLRKVYIS